MARIRDDGDKLIELFAEVALPKEVHTDAFVLQTYPRDYANKEVLSMVPAFAYPCAFRCDVVTHFSFVMTNIHSKWTFGYCRHTPKSDTCLVMLSDLPWHSTFYRILDHCAELAARQSSIPLEHFLEAMYTGDLPQPGLELNITYTCEELKLREFRVACQDHQKLPCIPEDRNVTEYFSAVNASNMIAIFASMLNERRIVITSDRLSRLSACVQAANALIYPMHWQHIFIPLLPSSLLDYLSAPMPFLVGVPQATLATVRRSELLEVVLLNADTNQLTTPYDDVNSLPSEVVHSLRKALKSNGNGGGGGSGSGSGSSSAVVNGSGSALGDGLSRAFMRALVSLIGGYRSALRIVPGEQITFDRELFLSSSGGGGVSKSTSRQLFLERLLQLQIFQQFIETRLDLFNAGQRLDDQFEMELNTMETGSGVNSRFRAQYREWAAVMKKEGGAFLRAVNPKVKSAISKSRQAVRTLRSKIGTNQNGGGGNNSGGSASSNGGGGSSPASSRQNSSTPSSPKLPPKIKKSISGTAISQTSRTVTYVRTPNSTVSTAGMGGKGGNHPHRSSVVRTTPNGTPTSTSTPIISTASTNVSSSRSSTLSVPSYASSSSIAPSASSESSDVDEMDASGGGGFGAPTNQYSSSVPRVDMNITAELESIFRNKATLATAGVTTNGGTSSTQRPLITTNNSNSFSSAAAPIPPPRTNNANSANASSSSSSSTSTSDKFGHLNRHSLKPATLALAKQAAEQAAGGAGNHRASAPEKCLIEFDSPPKDGLSPNELDQRNKAASSSALGALVHFDPLLEGSYGQQASSPPGVTQQQQQQQHPTSAAFFNASLQQQQPLNSGNLFFTPNNTNNNNVHAFANNFNSSTSNGFGYGNGQVLQHQQQPPPPALYPVLRSNGHNLLQRAPPMAQTQPAPPLPPPSSTLATNVNVMALRGRFEMHPAPFHNNNNTANNSTANSSGKQQQPPLVTTGGQTGASGASGNPFQAHCWQEFD